MDRWWTARRSSQTGTETNHTAGQDEETGYLATTPRRRNQRRRSCLRRCSDLRVGTLRISLEANPVTNKGYGRRMQPHFQPTARLLKFEAMVAHVDSVLPRAKCTSSIRQLPCSAIVSGLRVIAVAHIKRGSRIGSEQTPYPIRAYCMANTRRILPEHSILDFTNKRRISLGGRHQRRVAF